MPAPAGNASAEPVAPTPEAPADNLDFGDNSSNNQDSTAPSDDKPFDDEPFDAGVEADEETDPKKYIEQLTGKLGQSLRQYTDEQGQPDFDLEKFAINSLLSATHTAEMDEEDKNDIIKKVNTSGENDSENSDMGSSNDEPSNGNDNGNGNNDDLSDPINANDEEGLEEIQVLENKEEPIFVEPKKMSIFAPEGSPEFMEQNRLAEGLTNSKKMIILDKNALKAKLQETFNQDDMTQPAVEPVTKPVTKPTTEPSKPSRRDNPFRIEPDTIPQPDPKASE